MKRRTTLTLGAALLASPAYSYGLQAHEGNSRMSLVELSNARRDRTALPVYANNGELIGHLYGGRIERMNHLGMDSSLRLTKRELEENYRYAAAAAIALEDQAFYNSHIPGLNIKGILRAAKTNIEAGEIKEGGSSIADQVCGAMRENSNTKSKPKTKLEKIKKKLDDMSCGIALQSTYGAERTMNDYLTFGYLGEAYGVKAFALKYWDTNHPSIVQQVMMAAMFRHPYDGTIETLEDKIKPRTLVGLRALLDNGTLTPSEYQNTTHEVHAMQVIPAETVDDKSTNFIPDEPIQSVSLISEVYEPVVTMAIEDMRRELGSTWHGQVAYLELTVDPDAQYVAHANSAHYQSENYQPFGYPLHPETVVSFLYYNEQGEILAYSAELGDDANPSTRRDTLTQLAKHGKTSVKQAGSVNKLLLAGNASEAYDPNKFGHKDFRQSLAYSRSLGIYNAAIDIGIQPTERLYKIAACYGRKVNREYGYTPKFAEDFKDNLVGRLAFGWFHSDTEHITRILPEALTGNAMPDLHVIKSYTLKDGRTFSIDTSPDQEREDCADLMYNNGITETWINAPIKDGFLRTLKEEICYAKTGTISEDTGTGMRNTNVYTNMVSKACHGEYLEASFGRPDSKIDPGLPVSTQSAALASWFFHKELAALKNKAK